MPASWKTVRVFISSTFRDMQAERDWLVRFVFPKLREELLKHRIHFIDVDLRWGVTSDENALGVCREVIDHCHPRFMCILGGRYGWIPDGKDKSITADEVHYGVLDREVTRRGHSFFYFRKGEDTLKIPEDDARSGGYREFALVDEIKRFGLEKAEALAEERANKLAALKQSIIDAKLPLYWYNAEWSESEERLVGLQKFGERVYEELLQSIINDPELAPHFATEGTATSDEFAEERDQMEAFIEERVDQYILGSRERLMNKMLAFANTEGTPSIFVLTGEPGCGKSALLAMLVKQMWSAQSPVWSVQSLVPDNRKEDGANYFVIPHFVGASTGSTDLRRTLRRLCHALAEAANHTEPLPLDIKDLTTHFQKVLTEASAKQTIILVFDALNQLDATDGAHWMNWLPRELAPNVRIITSVIAPVEGEKEHQTLAILRNRKDAQVQALEPLEETDTLAIIEGYLKRYSKRLDAKQIAALKAKPASNLPLYVLTALEELRTLGTYEEITDRVEKLPGDARTLFGWILTERLAKDPGFRTREGKLCGTELVEKFAACLGVSRYGLSPAELTAILGSSDRLGNVAALLRLLRPYLMWRGELLDFYHGQFREAAGAAHLDTPEKQRSAHKSVATCLQAFVDPHSDGQCRDATPHALSELPHHQTHAEVWPDLIATLENIFFLEAKVAHGMTFDLVENFADAVRFLHGTHPHCRILSLIEDALGRDSHFIAQHHLDYPQALFQCLWNSCWWHKRPNASKWYEVRGVEGRKLIHTKEKETQECHTLLENWRRKKRAKTGGFHWLRSLLPPPHSLDNGSQFVFRECGEAAAFGFDGQLVTMCHGKEGVCVWQAGCYETGPLFLDIGRKSACSLAISQDETATGASFRENAVEVWSVGLTTKKLQECRLLSFQKRVRGAQLSGNAEFLSIVFDDAQLEIWQIDGPQMNLLTTMRQLAGLQCASVSDDGLRVVVGFDDGTVKVIHMGKRENQTFEFIPHTDRVTGVAVSPDGCYVASCSKDTSVCVWRLDQPNAEQKIFLGHSDWPCNVAFSKDGKQILSTCIDARVRIWNLSHSGGCQARILYSIPSSFRLSVWPDGRDLFKRPIILDVRVSNFEDGPMVNIKPCSKGFPYGRGSGYWMDYYKRTGVFSEFFTSAIGLVDSVRESDGIWLARGGVDLFVLKLEHD